MITRLSTLEELKQIFVETLLNKTDKITKVSDDSVLNGIAYGTSKVAQKALKDIALVESHIFPDGAYGQHLDLVAEKSGISPRFAASQSTTYVRVVGDPGTQYVAGVNIFSGNGEQFTLEVNTTIPAEGFTYAPVRSVGLGSKVNVPPLSINQVDPIPTGHTYVINEYMATGGRDIESDHLFRLRIKEGANLAASNTLAHYTQVFMKLNSLVLRLFYHGLDIDNKHTIAIATHNGATLTVNELDDLLSRAIEYFSLTDLNPWNDNVTSVVLTNITYQPVDIAFRVSLQDPSLAHSTRKDIQLSMSKKIDPRLWKKGQKVEWDDLLQIVKDHPNVKYVPDTLFFPSSDITIDLDKLPRIRAFVMMDMEGNIISDSPSQLNPIYYPSNTNIPYQETILAGLYL